MRQGIQPRAYETIVPKGSFKGEPNATTQTINLPCNWLTGETVVICANGNAYAAVLDVTIPGIDPSLIHFQYMPTAAPYIQVFTLLQSPIDFNGSITVTRATAGGHLRVLVQVYSGVGRIIPQDSQIPPSVPTFGTPNLAPPVTTTIPNSWVLGSFALIGQAITIYAPQPRIASAVSVVGTWHTATLGDVVEASPGTYQVTLNTSTSTAVLGRIALGLEPKQIGSEESFSLSLSAPSVSVGQQSSGSVGVTITPAGGFTGVVTLAVTGLPTGVTASFSPNPANGSSALNITVGAGAVPGTVNLTITGSAGLLSDSTSLSLTVVQTIFPSFSLSSYPSSIALKQGQQGTATITVSPANGFSGNVTLSATGLPAGVTATFAPNPATGSSVLTLTADLDAAETTTQITIQGTSASLSASTTILVSVSATRPPLDPALMRLATGLLLLKIPVEVPPQ